MCVLCVFVCVCVCVCVCLCGLIFFVEIACCCSFSFFVLFLVYLNVSYFFLVFLCEIFIDIIYTILKCSTRCNMTFWSGAFTPCLLNLG